MNAVLSVALASVLAFASPAVAVVSAGELFHGLRTAAADLELPPGLLPALIQSHVALAEAEMLIRLD